MTDATRRLAFPRLHRGEQPFCEECTAALDRWQRERGRRVFGEAYRDAR
jgi:hypothetical protein